MFMPTEYQLIKTVAHYPQRQGEASRGATVVHQPAPRSHASLSASHPLSQRRPIQQPALQRLTSDVVVENEIRSIFAGRTIPDATLFQGTESPYRVESPADLQSDMNAILSSANRRKGPTSVPSAASSGDPRSLPSSVSSSNGKDYRKAKAFQSQGSIARSHISGQASDSARIAAGVSNERNDNQPGRQSASSTSTYSISYAGLPVVSTNLTRKASPTIKSFLPVNKSFVQNSNSHSGNRTTSAITKDLTHTASQDVRPIPSSSRDRYFSTLQSPSPPPTFSTPQRGLSPTLDDLSSPCLTENESDSDLSSISLQRKRKANIDSLALGGKRQKAESSSMQLVKKAARKAAKSKQSKSEQVSVRSISTRLGVC